MKMYSVKVFRNDKWPKRGVRVVCNNKEEAIYHAKNRLGIPQEERVLVCYRVVLDKVSQPVLD